MVHSALAITARRGGAVARSSRQVGHCPAQAGLEGALPALELRRQPRLNMQRAVRSVSGCGRSMNVLSRTSAIALASAQEQTSRWSAMSQKRLSSSICLINGCARKRRSGLLQPSPRCWPSRRSPRRRPTTGTRRAPSHRRRISVAWSPPSTTEIRCAAKTARVSAFTRSPRERPTKPAPPDTPAPTRPLRRRNKNLSVSPGIRPWPAPARAGATTASRPSAGPLRAWKLTAP